MLTANSSTSTLLTAVLILLALSACGTAQGYPGPALSDSEVATIEISDPEGIGNIMSIQYVNGDRLYEPYADSVTLLPGCNSLVVQVLGDPNQLFYMSYMGYNACAKFAIRVEAGKTYLMREFNRLYVDVHDLTNNSRIGYGPLRTLGIFGVGDCQEEKEDAATQCIALGDGEAGSL